MSFSEYDQTIDSREIIERLEELRDERESLTYDIETAREALADAETLEVAGQQDGKPEVIDAAQAAREEATEALTDAEKALSDWDEENSEELRSLESVNEQGGQYADDWEHGTSMIHESYFVEYCKELVYEIGDLPQSISNYIEIDWEKTADNLKVDYTEIDFDGETFYVR